MLVLTRKIGEGILIGENVEVVVLSNNHGKVRLGIRAPREVPVVRDEIIKRERDNAKPAA